MRRTIRGRGSITGGPLAHLALIDSDPFATMSDIRHIRRMRRIRRQPKGGRVHDPAARQ